MNARVNNLHISPVAGAAGARLTVSSSAVLLTVPAGARYVAWQVQTNPVYVTFDGSTPSATNGFLYGAGSTGEWGAATASQAKFLRQSNDAHIYYSGFTD